MTYKIGRFMMSMKVPIDWLLGLRLYLAVSVVSHLLWELLQLPLYTIWKSGTAREIAFAVVHCTAGDLLIAALALIAALVAIGNRDWPHQRFVPVIVAAVVIGLSYTVYSEWLNTVVRKSWTYSRLMPTLPWLGTGLSPFMQWLIVPAIAFAAVRRRHPVTSF
jgi:uncharacterized membrane protein (UPF0136 family)